MRSRLLALLLPTLLLALSCSREPEGVRKYIEETGALPRGPGARAGDPLVQFTPPAGWERLGGSGMRLEAFRAPGAVEVALARLPGDGGGFEANLRRWFGQLGVAPGNLEVQQFIESLSNETTWGGWPLMLLDLSAFTREGAPTMLIAYAQGPNFVLTLKASASASALRGIQADFHALARSLRPGKMKMDRLATLRARACRLPVIRGFLDLRLQIIALLLLFLLTLWGTLYQVEHGLWASQQRFFYSWFFVSGGFFPFPGAKLVLAYLFVSLLLVTVLRLSYRAQKTGLILIHWGLLVLLAGGGITHFQAVESFLSLKEGERSNLTSDYRNWEISVWTERAPATNGLPEKRAVEAIDTVRLLGGKAVLFPDAALTLIPRRLFQNARPNPEAPPAGPQSASGFTGLSAAAPQADPAQDLPGGEFTVFAAGATNQILLWAGEASLHLGEKTIQLRRKRHPLPASLALKRFTKEEHPGTAVARRYESRVQLSEPRLSREVLIRMNEPLRFADYTVYQSSYSEEEGVPVSVFAVVKNGGRIVPYLASVLLFLGMLIHFGIMLVGRVRRREAR